MYRLIRISLLFMLPILAGRLNAQTISASPYSVYGIGLLKEKNSALNRAMAGTGIGLRDGSYLNHLNPASYTSLQTATQVFEMGMYMESDRYQTNQQSDKFKTGNITGINAWFRFSKNWAGAIGIAPFSQVNYTIASARNTGVDQNSTVQYSGSGGISQFYFGNGIQITKNLSLGINGSYIFGSIEKNESISSGLGYGTTLKNKISANRLNLDFGAQYTFFLKKNRSLTVGVTYDDKLRLNTSGDITALTIQGDTLTTEKSKVEDYILPSRLGTGLSFQTPRSTIAADITFQNWSEARLDENVKLRNTKRFSLGYEYKGNPKGDRYWDFVALRTGFYVQDNYLVLGKTSFTDWGLSGGVGMPVSGNRGSINLSYHYNRSGTLDNNLVSQQAHVIVLDITFRDLWGIRRKFD